MKTARITLLFIFVLTFLGAQAQDVPPGFKSWWWGGLTVRVSPRFSVKASNLAAFNSSPYRLQFLQPQVAGSMAFGESWRVAGGYAPSIFNTSEGFRLYSRLFSEGTHSMRFGNLRMKNSLRAEWHFPQQRKYRFRFILANRLSLKTKLPLRASPYIRNQLYYYLGGRPVVHSLGEQGEFEEGEFEEDEEAGEEGELDEEAFAPNGFHRYRLTVGLRLRLAKRLYGSVYYIWQREFNSGLSPNTELNMPHPESGKIQAPFNNFSLIGVGISYTIKTY